VQRRAVRLNDLAARLQAEGDGRRPEKLYLRAIALLEAHLGPDHPDGAVTLCNLGLFYKATGRLAEARPLYERALSILEKTFGPSDERVGVLLYNLAQLLKSQAAAHERRSERIEADAAEMADPRVRARAVVRRELAKVELRVGPSRIHRFGLFAGEAIPRGRRLLEYTGERVARKEAVRRWNAERTYLLRLDAHWRLDGSVRGSGAELINHCCEPNCRFVIREGRAWVLSVRPIAANEELLVDYKFPSDSERIECHCGARSCRGMINAR
jgi:tetratricopeptide (TPR) repeat protein